MCSSDLHGILLPPDFKSVREATQDDQGLHPDRTKHHVFSLILNGKPVGDAESQCEISCSGNGTNMERRKPGLRPPFPSPTLS